MRNYVASIPGGAATTSIQIQSGQTFKTLTVSMANAAAGTLEASISSASQIAVAQPTSEVVARVRNSATAGTINVVIPINLKRAAFEYLYLHQTGAGNVGEVNLA